VNAARTLHEKSKGNERMQYEQSRGNAHATKPNHIDSSYGKVVDAKGRSAAEPDKVKGAERTRPGKATDTLDKLDKGQTIESPIVERSLQTRILNEATRKQYAEYKTGDRGEYKAKPAAAQDNERKKVGPAMARYKEKKQALREKTQTRIEKQSQGQSMNRGR